MRDEQIALIPRQLRRRMRASKRAAGQGRDIRHFVWTIRPADGIRAITSSPTGRVPMKLFLLKFFTWWNGQTFGTQLWTWRFGELVGQDEQGNRYYRTKGRKIDPTLGFERRWVVYNGYAEATKIPPSVARLDASHRRRRADRRELHAARMGKAACPEHDRHARRPIVRPARRSRAAAGPRPPATTRPGRPETDCASSLRRHHRRRRRRPRADQIVRSRTL